MGVTTTRSTLVPFLPYLVIALVHIVSLAIRTDLLSHLSKPLLMPALAAALVLSVRSAGSGRTTAIAIACVAITFSWIGDLLLSIPGTLEFLLGLGGFLVAHIAYVVLFARELRVRRLRPAAAVFVVWWVALVAIVFPYLGTQLVPLVIYGLALGASAAVGLSCNRYIAIGAITFLASDTILAFKFFCPGFSMWQQDAIIMLLYCAGQGLIIYGVTRAVVPSSRATHREAVAA